MRPIRDEIKDMIVWGLAGVLGAMAVAVFVVLLLHAWQRLTG